MTLPNVPSAISDTTVYSPSLDGGYAFGMSSAMVDNVEGEYGGEGGGDENE